MCDATAMCAQCRHGQALRAVSSPHSWLKRSRHSAAMCMLDTPTCPGPGTLDWVYKSPAPYVTTLLRHLCMLLTPFLRSPLNKLDRASCLLAGRPAQMRCLASAAKRAGGLLSQGPGCWLLKDLIPGTWLYSPGMEHQSGALESSAISQTPLKEC